eukprot:228812-Prorocentrum_minimum.AAC.3
MGHTYKADPSDRAVGGGLEKTSTQAPESTVGWPMAARRQGIYDEYSMEYLKCRALNGTLVSTVDDS